MAQNLLRGSSVQLADTRIVGTIELPPGTTINAPFTCSRCVLTGSVQASGVTFAAPVEFTGSQIAGDFEAVGSQFDDVIVLGSDGTRRTSVLGDVRLDGAEFDRGATFDQTQFHAQVNLSVAAFNALVSFTDSNFAGPAIFDHAAFGGPALFTAHRSDRPKATTCANAFHQEASFAGAIFGSDADFTGRCFGGPATFTDANFRGRTSFADTKFSADANFTAAKFQRGATFSNATFDKNATFVSLDVGGSVGFPAADLRGKQLSFAHATGSGTISLQGTSLARRDALVLAVTSKPNVLASDTSVDHVSKSNRASALRLVEQSATNSGDVGLANDARYRRLAERHATLTGLPQLIDGLLYRDAAGYLVKPTHPAVALLLLVALGGLLRWFPRLRDEGRDLLKKLKGWQGVSGLKPPLIDRLRFYEVKLERAVGALPGGVLKSAGTAARPTPDISLDNPRSPTAYLKTLLQWLEYLGQKLLLVALGVGLLAQFESTRKVLQMLGF